MAALKDSLKRAFLSAFSGRFSADRDENRMRTTDDRLSEVKLTSLLGPFESYVVTAQSILIWEKPMASCIVLALVNAVFWLAVSSDIKFYFVVAASMAGVHVYRTWTNQIWPEIRVPLPEGEDTEEWTPVNPQVFSVPEISRYLGQMSETTSQWTTWLVKTRRKQPGMFCILTSCTLAMTAWIGCYITGVFQAYFTLMAIMLGPGFVVHVYPMMSHFLNTDARPNLDLVRIKDDDDDDDDEATLAAANPLRSVYGDTEDQELEQFLPEVNQETMDLLTRAVEATPNRDSASSSVMASQELGLDFSAVQDDDELMSFQAGLSSLPSYDQADSDDDQDFIDGNGSIPATLPPPSRRHSESPEIRFVPSYFDDDSEDAAATSSPIKRVPTTSSSVDHQRSKSSTSTMTTTALVSRQSSTSPSDVEVSDYEMLSESELS